MDDHEILRVFREVGSSGPRGDAEDQEMLKVLREAMSPDPSGEEEDPPARALDAAYAAGEWVRLDEELAELVADSAEMAAPLGVRASQAYSRQLTFQLEDLTLECELDADALLGQVASARDLRLEVVWPDGSRRPIDLDADGRFLVRPRPRGPVAIRCTGPAGPAIVTPWFLA